MGAIEETRKLIQDFLAPELREIKTRLESLEAATKTRFDAIEETTKARFDAQGRYDCAARSRPERAQQPYQLCGAG